MWRPKRKSAFRPIIIFRFPDVRQFIQSLIERDMVYHKGLLCLIDGSKGLYAALTKAFSGYVVIQRCQWHKRENFTSYLPKNKQDQIKKALQQAVKRCTNSLQRSRWLTNALLDIEPRLRRVKGFRYLPLLRRALQKDLMIDSDRQDALATD